MMIRLQQNEKIYKKQKMNFREQTMTDTKLLELEKEIVTLKNKIKESGRYKLREQVASLTKENERLKTVPMKYRRMEFNAQLQNQLAATQATNERLREALEAVETTCSYNGPEDEIGEHSCCHELSYLPHSPDCWTHLRTKALALPNDTTALDARLKEERERCAVEAWMYYARVCKQKGLNPHHYGEWIASDAIRSIT